MYSFDATAVIAGVAVAAPLVVRLSPVKVPATVLELLLGIVIGRQVLHWASVDEPAQVLATVGLAFLLLLSGLEVDIARLSRPLLKATSTGWLASLLLALAVGAALAAAGLVRSPLLIAVILSATSLGVVLPILTDAGRTADPFGELVIAAASIAELAPIVLLSVFFAGRSGGLGARLVLLTAFVVLATVVGTLIAGVERAGWLAQALINLQDTTAEIRVRGALALLMLFAALASHFGLEAILGAFLAGATMKALDRDDGGTHLLFPVKLRAVGYGAFVPFFFVVTGMTLDVRSLLHPAIVARVPVFLMALLVARAAPVVLYRAHPPRELLAGGLFQATSLSVPVVGGAIGVDLGLLTPGNYAALVAAGLLSVIVLPALALAVLPSSTPTAPEASAGNAAAPA